MKNFFLNLRNKLSAINYKAIGQFIGKVLVIVAVLAGVYFLIMSGGDLVNSDSEPIFSISKDTVSVESSVSTDAETGEIIESEPIDYLGVWEVGRYIYLSPCYECPATAALGPGTYNVIEEKDAWCRIEYTTEAWVSCQLLKGE